MCNMVMIVSIVVEILDIACKFKDLQYPGSYQVKNYVRVLNEIIPMQKTINMRKPDIANENMRI